MGGSHSKPVTVDISKHSGNVQSGDKGGHYYDSDSRRVNLTDEWYPDPEGTYKKFKHIPESGNIQSITHNDAPQTLSPNSLPQYSSVTVYYWSLDSTCATPLLIQLGTGDTDKYYKHAGIEDTWSKDKEANVSLREELNKQNCGRNKAHIIDISQKRTSSYNCPSCGYKRKIQTNYQSSSDFTYCAHSITGDSHSSGSLSISGFIDSRNWQVGLPSIKDISVITINFISNTNTPIVINYNKGGEKYFKRNTKTSNSWVAVPKGQESNLLNDRNYYPKITPYISSKAKTYTDEGTGISITVRNSPIGDGYWKFEHSLVGGLFTVESVVHDSTPLEGIESSPDTHLESISSYYCGNTPTDLPKLLLVELSIKTSDKTTYKYYCGDKKNAPSWSKYPGSDGTTQLRGAPLKTELDRLRKIHFPDTGLSTGAKAGIGITSVGAGGGIICLGIWKGPALIARLITRM